MGKQGPCYHCGITTTPLWRNGPPYKPVLCNACGSRWRTKGTLENYMPMHAGGCGENDSSAQMEWSRPKNGSTRPLQRRCIKRKQFYSGYLDSESILWLADPPLSKNTDEEFSNISSLGSTISTSDVPMRCGNSGGAEFPVHRIWETPIPSKKRTTMYRFRASFEKITRKLMAIDEPEVSSVICPASDSLALRDSSPLVAADIGLGSGFLRQPIPVIQEPESEASSFIINKKACDGLDGFRRGSSRCLVSLMNHNKFFKDKDMNNLKRESFPYNKHNVLQSFQSPLNFIEMKDLVNFDTFTSLLTYQEQVQLMKTLAPVDTSEKTDSLKYMFESSQFEAAISNFQQLLCKGMFDTLDRCQTVPLLKHFEQLFILLDLSKSGWMEQYFQLQKATKCRGSAEKLPEFRNSSKDKPKGYNVSSHPFSAPGESKSLSGRLPDQALNKEALRSSTYSDSIFVVSTMAKPMTPKDVCGYAAKPSAIGNTSGVSNECDVGSHYWMYNGSTSMSLSPQGHGLSGGFGSTLTGDEQDSNSEHDLLVNIPSTRSFQQAELLQLPSSGKCSYANLKAEDCGQGEAENGSLIIANTWHMDNASAWDGLIWKTPHTDSETLLPNGSIVNP